MADTTIDLSRLIATAQATTIAINNLNQTINNVFPQFVATAATATGGSATLPGSPVGFLELTIPGVGTVKVPYYAT